MFLRMFILCYDFYLSLFRCFKICVFLSYDCISHDFLLDVALGDDIVAQFEWIVF